MDYSRINTHLHSENGYLLVIGPRGDPDTPTPLNEI